MITPSPRVLLHQIAYSPATLAALEPGYTAVDNLANPRPDWYEYWPIRQILLSLPLDEMAFYGFFSAKFGRKTGLTHGQTCAVVLQAAAKGCDVVLFSPQSNMGAFFLNVFEQNETFDPGFIAASEDFLKHIGRPAPLRYLVMDERQIVHCNYFVARPAFWRDWLSLNEALFSVCEGPATPQQRALKQATGYPGAARRQAFLQERTASLLLTVQPQSRSHAANPFTMAWSTLRLREHPTDEVMSDALKIAFREHGYPHYMRAFSTLRQRFAAGRSGTKNLTWARACSRSTASISNTGRTAGAICKPTAGPMTVDSGAVLHWPAVADGDYGALGCAKSQPATDCQSRKHPTVDLVLH